MLIPRLAWGVCGLDEDGDGYEAAGPNCPGDCDDFDPTVHPGAEEVCDGVDTNCDGVPHLAGGIAPDWLSAGFDGAFRANRYELTQDVRLRRVDAYLDGSAAAYFVVGVESSSGIPTSPETAVVADVVNGWARSAALDLDLQEGDVVWVGFQLLSAGSFGHASSSDVPLTQDFGRWLESRSGAGLQLDLALPSATPYAIRLGYDDEVDDDGDGSPECVDCDDADPDRRPGAEELCDGVDNDCSGSVPSWDRDEDGDGVALCEDDCDDANADVFPGAAEACDGLDSDCDGLLPDVETVDEDGDGALACADCDDLDPALHPGAEELCDELDTDCDGVVPAVEVADADGDGAPVCADCDDEQPQIAPGMEEACDGVDTDCDGVVPDGEVDADGDSWLACRECDDTDPGRTPGQAEACDGVDANCDDTLGWRMDGLLRVRNFVDGGLVGQQLRPALDLWLQEGRTWVSAADSGLVGHVLFVEIDGGWQELWRDEQTLIAPYTGYIRSRPEVPTELDEDRTYVLGFFTTVPLTVFDPRTDLPLAPGLVDERAIEAPGWDLGSDELAFTNADQASGVYARFLGETDEDGDGILDCFGPTEVGPSCAAPSAGCGPSGSLALLPLLPLLGLRRRC